MARLHDDQRFGHVEGAEFVDGPADHHLCLGAGDEDAGADREFQVAEVGGTGDVLQGFAVGAAERGTLLPRDVQPGDAILGLASSGVHSNAFSLVRRIVAASGLSWTAPAPYAPDQSLGQALMTPTRIYVRPVQRILQHYPIKKRVVRGLAHITGGGLVDNVPRILPPGRRVFIKRGAWEMPPIFPWLQKLGNIDQEEMDRVFNCGIGFVMIVSAYFAESIHRRLREDRVPTYVVGEVRDGEPGVEFY